jgi:hypothetical protein
MCEIDDGVEKPEENNRERERSRSKEKENM